MVEKVVVVEKVIVMEKVPLVVVDLGTKVESRKKEKIWNCGKAV